MKKLLIFTMLMLTTIVGAFSQSGSFGSTYAASGGEMVIFGQHSFQNGSGTINAGIIATERSAPTGLFSWATGGSWVNASNNAFVDGYALTYGTGSFVFPIGDNNVYRPAAVSAATITNPATAAYYGVSGTSAITSNVAGGNHPVLPSGGPFATSSKATNISAVDNVEYWDINGDQVANITLTWDATSNIAALTSSDLSKLTIVGWDGTKWVAVASTVNASQLLQNTSTASFTGAASSLAAGSITTNAAIAPNSYSVYTLAALGNAFAVTNSSVNIATGYNTAQLGQASSAINPTGGLQPYSYSSATASGSATTASTRGGTISVNPTTGAYVYTPATGYVGKDTFYIKVCDATPTCIVVPFYATITGPFIITNPVINKPTNPNTPVNGNVFNDVTPTGGTQPYSYSGATISGGASSTSNRGGTLTVDPATGVYSYNPPTNYVGKDTFYIKVCDATTPTPSCNVVPYYITVGSPFTFGNSSVNINTNSNTPASGNASSLFNLSGGLQPYNYAGSNASGAASTTSTGGGTFVVNPTTGNFTYTPATGFSGYDTIYIKVCDNATPTPKCNVGRVVVYVAPGTPSGNCNMSASIDVNSLIQCATNNSYQFTGNVTGGTAPYTYLWDLNDGTNAYTKDVTHTYATYGEHDVTFIVRDANGCTANASTVQIYIGAKPAGSFDIYPNSGTGKGITFGSTSTIGNGWMTYQWDLGNGATSTLSNPGPIYYAAGTYIVKMIVTGNVANGTACSDTVTKTINVDGNGNICIAPTTSFTTSVTSACLAGNNIAFYNASSNATSYSWNFGDGFTSSSIAPTHRYTAAGSYTVTLTSTNSCGSSSATQTIVINNIPAAPAAITGASTVAAGSTITLASTTTGGVWSSSNSAVATVNPSTGVVTGVAAGSATISYTVSNACGNNNATKAIIVSGPVPPPCTAPVANFSINTASQCLSGNAFTFTNSSTGTTPTYTWSYGDGSATATTDNGSYSYAAAGTYTVTLTATNACGTNSTTRTVTVKAASASSTSVTVCSSALPYTWNGTAYNAAGTYTRTLTNAAGCDSIATLVLAVNSAPAQPAAISGSVGIVVGNSTTLASTTTGGVWGSSNSLVATVNPSTGVVTGVSAGTVTITYAVTNGCGSASRTQTILVSAACVPTTSSASVAVCSSALPYIWNGVSYYSAGTYSKTFVNGNATGCDSTATLVLTVNSAPAQPAAISGSNSIVVGNTTTLSSATAGGSWSSGNTAVATVNPSTGVVTGVATGSVTITYTVTNSCGSNSSNLLVTVNTACVTPVANFTVNNATQCIGGNSFVFTNSTTGTVSGYTWNFGDGSSTVASPTHTYAAAGTYTVTLTAASGCGGSSKSITVTVLPSPVVPVISGTTGTIVGGTTTLSATPAGGVWSSSNTAVATVNPSTGVVTGVTAGSATITYTVTTTCGTASATTAISVSCNLQASFTINNAVQCVTNNNFVYTSTVTGGVAPYTYAWNFHDGSTSAVANPTKVYATYGEGNVQLQVTDSRGCVATATPKYEVVGAQPTANFSVIDNTGTGTSKTFISSSTIPAGSMSYAWNFGNGQTSTLINPTIGFVPGNYIVTLVVTGNGGCTATATQSITQSITSSVSIYPNPVVGQVEVSFRSASVTPTTVQVLDLSGRLIQTQTLTPAYTGQLVNATFNMGGLQSGSYVLKIIDQQNGVLVTKTLLKQ